MQSYTDKSDRQLVQKASDEIDLGATDGEGAVNRASMANQEFSQRQCCDPQGEQANASGAFSGALKHLGDGFSALGKV